MLEFFNPDLFDMTLESTTAYYYSFFSAAAAGVCIAAGAAVVPAAVDAAALTVVGATNGSASLTQPWLPSSRKQIECWIFWEQYNS